MKSVYVFCNNHPIYESLVKFPVEGFEYKSNVDFSKVNEMEIYQKNYEKKKKLAQKILNFFKLPRTTYLFGATQCDLILSCRGVLPINIQPFIVEIEHASSFGSKDIPKKKIEKRLANKNCKFIISRCKAVTNSLLNTLDCSKFKEKIVEVYPAIELKEFKKEEHKFTILFISGYKSFFRKGGRELLESFRILKETYPNIKLIIRGYVPEEYKNKFKEVEYIDENIPHSEIYEKLYSKADVLVLPTYFDAFGYVLLEGMVAKIPVISTDVFAIPEIIEEGKNGFLIHSPISDYDEKGLHKGLKEEDVEKEDLKEVVNQLVEKISLLIINPELKKQMGEEGYKLVSEGKFSIKERNKKLKELYEVALKWRKYCLDY